MEAWLIVLITIGSGLALFIALFILKNKSEQRKEAMRANQTVTNVQAASVPYPLQQLPPNYYQQPPPNYYQTNVPPQQQQQQGQIVVVHGSIPSTANQGVINVRDPNSYYNTSSAVHNPMYNPRVNRATLNTIVI